MALRNMNQAANDTEGKFEAMEDTVEQAQAAQTEAAAPAPAPAPAAAAPSASRAVAQANPQALATRKAIQANSLMSLKDAFPIQWDTVERILAASGKFKFKDNDHVLGEKIKIDLMSWQDRWVCSPNAKNAPVELVKYSDDGETCTDGTDLKQHLAEIKEDWPNARIDQRLVIMGELVGESGKTESGRLESLVQIDLPPTGAAAFKAYILQAAYAASKGKKTFEETKVLDLEAVGATNKKGDEFTKIVFNL